MPLDLAELTSTPDGRLFAFYGVGDSTALSQVNPSSGRVVTTTSFSGLPEGAAWALAYRTGDFYLFTSPRGTSVVHRYRPSDASLQEIATLDATIFGAGVSTCAPEF